MKSNRIHVLLLSAMGVWGCSDDSDATARILPQRLTPDAVVTSGPDTMNLRSFDVFRDRATASLLGLGFDVEVGFDGSLQFKPSVGSNDVWEYALSTTLSRAGEGVPLGATSVEREGAELWMRNGTVDQRLRHEDHGLSLEYVVHKRPAGTGPLTLQYEAPGHDHRVHDGVVQVQREGKDVFRWQTFRAWDARQMELSVRVGAKGGRFWMDVDDTNATYPITIDPVSTAPFWTQKGVEVGARFGFSVATADVTGDGVADVIVAQQRYSGPEIQEGRVLVFPGTGTGVSSTAVWSYEGNQDYANLGSNLAAAGDIDGDTVDDFGVSAPYWSGADPLFEAGQIYVFRGGMPLSSTPHAVLTGAGAEANLGYSLAFGDYNCDGRPDLVSGSPNTRNGDGEALVFTNIAGNFGVGPAYVYSGVMDATENFGTDVSFVNVNGDASNGVPCDDIVVGSPSHANNQGRISVYQGSTNGLAAPTVYLSGVAGSRMGESLAEGGDINFDGFEDVVTGAPNFSGAVATEGATFVFPGSTLGLQTPSILAGGQSGSRTGFSVATADINNDGFADVLVGANQFSNPETNEGRLLVYQGQATGVSVTPSSTFESNAVNAFLGDSVASGTDLNGDGVLDVLVGARAYPDDSQPSNPVGAVLAFAGNVDCTIGGEFYAQGATHPNNPCEVCDVATSRTAWSVGNEGAACDDNSACSTQDVCQMGVCQGVAVDCNDQNTCTDDVCDPSTGLCEHLPVPVLTACDDGLFCTEIDACDAGGSCVGTPRDCSAATTECFTGAVCDEAVDLCVPAFPSAVGTPCGGDLCMTNGTCDGAGICSGTPVDCSMFDGECTIGTCNPTDGQCVAQNRMDGSGCDDGDSCTTGDACLMGVCGGQTLNCDDTSDCTTDSCQNGTCVHAVAEGCFIDSTCVAEGATSLEDACQICDPTIAVDAYSTANAGTACGEAACTEDRTAVQTPRCNANGQCRPGTNAAISCGAYVCEAGACLTVCVEDGDCQSGFVCDQSACVEDAGEDAGPDAGGDVGSDAGGDAGPDAGGDAGPDAGGDVGSDAGGDAGPDAGGDAGPDAGGDDTGNVPNTGDLSGSGCACSSTDGPTDVSWLFGMFGVFALGRRR